MRYPFVPPASRVAALLARACLGSGPLLLLLALGILTLSGAPHALAQAGAEPFLWVRTITGTGANPNGGAFAVAFDNQDNVIAGGRISGDGGTDFTVVKYDPAGNQRWLRTVPGAFGTATAVAAGADGSVFAAGNRQVGGVGQSVVAKWDADGVLKWTMTFSPNASIGSHSATLALDGNGDVIVGGSISTQDFNSDWAVAKLRNTNGSIAWVQRGRGIAGVGANFVLSLAVDGSNHIAAAGYGPAGNGPLGFLVTRLNGATGAPFWGRYDGDPDLSEQAITVSVTPGGHVVAGGYFTVGEQRVGTVAKYNRDTGTRMWIDQSLGRGNGGVGASALQVSSRGNAVAVGIAEPTPQVLNVTAAEFRDASGVPLWNTAVPPMVANGFAFANDGALDPQDRLVAGGGSGGSNPFFEDFAVWQFDAGGTLARTRVLPSIPNGQGEVQSVATDRQGNAVAGGYYQTAANGSVQFTVAYLDPAIPPSFGATRLRVSAPATVTASGNFNFTVTAQDTVGNTVPGYRGTVRFTSTDAQAVLPANYTFTVADNGVHTFTGRLKTVGARTITANDTASPLVMGSASVEVQPAPDMVPPVITRVEVEPRTVSGAGGRIGIRVIATDNVGVQGVTGTVTLGQTSTPVTFLRVAGRGFIGEFVALANTASQSLRYTLSVQARDAAGNSVTADGGTITVGPRRVSQRDLVLHQNQERREFTAYARGLRVQYRGIPGRRGQLVRAAVERHLRDVLLALRAHWRQENRFRAILLPSPLPPSPPFTPPA